MPKYTCLPKAFTLHISFSRNGLELLFSKSVGLMWVKRKKYQVSGMNVSKSVISISFPKILLWHTFERLFSGRKRTKKSCSTFENINEERKRTVVCLPRALFFKKNNVESKKKTNITSNYFQNNRKLKKLFSYQSWMSQEDFQDQFFFKLSFFAVELFQTSQSLTKVHKNMKMNLLAKLSLHRGIHLHPCVWIRLPSFFADSWKSTTLSRLLKLLIGLFISLVLRKLKCFFCPAPRTSDLDEILPSFILFCEMSPNF